MLTFVEICLGLAFLSFVIYMWVKSARARRELELHSITPVALHALLAAQADVLLLDVRRPLDLLTDTEIIPGSTRISPQDVLRNPSLIPRDRDAVVYCTSPGEKTSRRIVSQALAMHFTRFKLLRGGLPAWKASGFPVVPYNQPFQLDIRT